ncbi:glycosyltransferase involved in cell wall biosynthesis [Sphingomonas jejuensis]|uniref:Glycosyltransferase involved in cell wall biosynthesis n=1 Tax=Sphingomonas jejuensis TaxID=904715 RepID=A0ABX0XJA7_9SPHN|nr:glycosyltransferase involved in cell wall biosynthesis [Sphingomonas jejuensis]
MVNAPDVELSLVVPVYNEAPSIDLFLVEAAPVLEAITPAWEVVFVNDGSRDGTLEAIIAAHGRDPRVKLIDLSRNFGKELALTAGLDHARGRAVIPMDVDLQDPVAVLPRLVDAWRGGADMVLAKRVDRKTDSLAKRWSATAFYGVLNRASTVDIPHNVGDFRLMDRKVVDALGSYRERERFMKGLFAHLGFRQAVVEYTRAPRAAGQSKFRFVRLWALGLEGIISFSTRPLKVWTYIGVAVAAVSLAYMVWIVVRTIIFGIDLPGYASLLTVMLFMNGLVLTGLGVIGEYVARIFSEVKGRPLYLVRGRLGVEDARGRS